MKTWKRMAAAVAAVTMLCPALAQAATCSQANLSGKWRIHFTPSNSFWMECTFAVAPNGTTILSPDNCKTRAVARTTYKLANVKFTMGTAASGAACSVTGEFTVNRIPDGKAPIPLPNTIVSGSMTQDHQAVHGIGIQTSGFYYAFAMVKIPN